MTEPGEPLLDAWRINARVTSFLVESLPADLWSASLPGSPRRTFRSLAAHLHNSRRLWMRSLATGAGIPLPAPVDRLGVTPAALAAALGESGGRILLMLEAGLANGCSFPGVSRPFFYGAMPRNVALFVAYAVSHEAHHRGQVVLSGGAVGRPLPQEVTAGLWQWSARVREARVLRGPHLV